MCQGHQFHLYGFGVNRDLETFSEGPPVEDIYSAVDNLEHAFGWSPSGMHYFAHRKPTNSREPFGGWLSRYSTQRFTGAPSKLPPRITRLVFTFRNSVESRDRFPAGAGLFR